MRTPTRSILFLVIHLNTILVLLGCGGHDSLVQGSSDDDRAPTALIETLKIDGIIYATRSDNGTLTIVDEAGNPIATSKFTQLFHTGFQSRYEDDSSVEGLIIYGSSLGVELMGSGSASITVVKVRDGECLLEIDHQDFLIAPNELVANVRRNWLESKRSTEGR